jgi:spore cortex biosynthesis protein YabQ
MPILSMSGQAWLFVTTVLVGGAVGLFYDVFRVARRVARHGRFLINLQDGIFWLCTVVFVFYYMLHRNSGEVSWFVLVGMAVGAAIYFSTVSHWVVRGGTAAVRYIMRVIAGVISVILAPLRLIYKFLKRPFVFIVTNIKKPLRKLRRYGKLKWQKAARHRAIIRKKK